MVWQFSAIVSLEVRLPFAQFSHLHRRSVYRDVVSRVELELASDSSVEFGSVASLSSLEFGLRFVMKDVQFVEESVWN